MDISSVITLDDAAHVASGVRAGLASLRDAQWWKLPGDDLLAAARDVEALARSLYAVQVHLAGEIDLAKLAQTHGQTSTAVLLRQTLNISAAAAAGRVRVARQVLPQDAITGGELPPMLPALGAALDAGDLGADQVQVISRALQALPKALDPDTRNLCETTLVEQGALVDPQQLARVAQAIAVIVDPDGRLDPDVEPSTRMDLALGTRDPRTGLTRLRGTLDDHAVEVFRQATTALAAPRPAVDGVPDRRTPGNRLAHAHIQALQGFLDSGAGPAQGGERPHITMTLSYDMLTRQLGGATLQYGGPVPAPVARRLLCDCAVIPAVLGGHGETLDIGRATRVWPAGIRRAITLRDIGCTWPGCDRPAAWCEIHHLIPWTEGGPTSVENGALFCGAHHAEIHRGHWQARPGPDSRPELIPPTYIDPVQQPRRNTLHHTHRMRS